MVVPLQGIERINYDNMQRLLTASDGSFLNQKIKEEEQAKQSKRLKDVFGSTYEALLRKCWPSQEDLSRSDLDRLREMQREFEQETFYKRFNLEQIFNRLEYLVIQAKSGKFDPVRYSMPEERLDPYNIFMKKLRAGHLADPEVAAEMEHIQREKSQTHGLKPGHLWWENIEKKQKTRFSAAEKKANSRAPRISKAEEQASMLKYDSQDIRKHLRKAGPWKLMSHAVAILYAICEKFSFCMRAQRNATRLTEFQTALKNGDGSIPLQCPCGKSLRVHVKDAHLLSTCGHVHCWCCWDKVMQQGRPSCNYPGCDATAAKNQWFDSSTLRTDTTRSPYGIKLQGIIDIIKGTKNDERVIIFVQWEPLMKTIAASLKENGTKCQSLSTGPFQRRTWEKQIEEFKDPESNLKVLLADSSNEAVAGA